MSDLRSQLHKEARNNILQYALLRWESAAVIALTLIVYFLAPGPLGLPGEIWLLLGLAVVALLVVGAARELLRYLTLAGYHGYDALGYRVQMDWYSTLLFFGTFGVLGGTVLVPLGVSLKRAAVPLGE